ncbi:Metallo-dependent phosphatase [Piedraia hortae CBS 480.64]|uniref:Metallo-dependent phosphatase n=1 Tax=Piedraia hortae CBS 480.64 TaxID=1314780 RepID=A0A6A7BTI5_9PEZI|nr:Metallo-dependent phosphatase [Piedraia hortae CBS 480.64]
MDTAGRFLTALASILLRLCAYLFLRWIPGHHFPPAIWALLAAYIPSFVYQLVNLSPWALVDDEIDILVPDEDDVDLEDIDVVETVTVRKKSPQIIKTLLTGLPSPTSFFWSAVTFAINIALAAMVWDFVYRATLFHPARDLSLARAGYVSDSAAHILVREPEISQLPISVSYRYADPPLAHPFHDPDWKRAGHLEWLDESTDYTGTFTLTGLRPDTKYEWATSNNRSGTFVTAPRPGHTSSRLDSPGRFTFLHTSCLKNNFPYRPFSNPLSNTGLKLLGEKVGELHARFMLFLGDFIYIDVPHRHGSTAEHYRREYRQTYASPDWEGATRELPWIHVYDDHEIANDWDGNTTGIFRAADDPYQHYHISVNPPPVRSGRTYFSFTHGPATFFMLDTRRYRSPNDATDGADPVTGEATKTMLGQEQLADLLQWLQRPEPAGVRWKIVISSVPFTQNWYVNAQDTWRGYLGERQVILEAMWDVGLMEGGLGVVVLSGDRHEFAATAFPPPPEGVIEVLGMPHGGDPLRPRENPSLLRTRRKRWPAKATVHEFSVSPLNMFYLPTRSYAEPSPDEDGYVSDVRIKYIPDGNSKFGAVSIDDPGTSDQSLLHYRLFVDGKEAWSYMLSAGGGGNKI